MNQHLSPQPHHRVWALFCLLLALSGCAAMSDQKCKDTAAAPHGWRAVGDNDGSQGEAIEDRLERYRDACEDVQVQPRRGDYIKGWKQGVKRYCTIQNAYDVGRRGRQFHDEHCRGVFDRLDLLNTNWQLGYEIDKQKSRISSLESELSSARSTMCKNEVVPPDEKRTKRNACESRTQSRIWSLESEISREKSVLSELESRPLRLE